MGEGWRAGGEQENVDNAYKFIRYIPHPEIGKAISEECGYVTPNLASLALRDESLRNDRTVYPGATDLKNTRFQIDVGDAVKGYEKYWELLKAGCE